METEDTFDSARIASLTRLMAELEQTRLPTDTFEVIRRGLAGLYGPAAVMLVSTQGLAEGQYRLIQLHLGDVTALNTDPWSAAELPVRSGGVIGRIIREARPRIINGVDWSADPYFHETLADYHSLAVIPLPDRHVPIDWVILLKNRGERFTGEELEQAVLRATLVGSLLASQALAEDLRKANERIDADARQVGELQRALLPDPLPKIPGLEIAVSYEPSAQAGGDWYDLFPLDGENAIDGRWCMFMGDASGHGLAAAVVMAIVQSILRVGPADVRGPADLLAYANRQLCRKRLGGFVTAFLGIYEPKARRLTYASAGHPPPLMKAADHRVSRLDRVASYPIGIEASETFREADVVLHPGDTLLFYTDGITEARQGRSEMFEIERLEKEFGDHRGSPSDLIRHLREAVNAFQQGKPPADDQTLLAATCA